MNKRTKARVFAGILVLAVYPVIFIDNESVKLLALWVQSLALGYQFGLRSRFSDESN